MEWSLCAVSVSLAKVLELTKLVGELRGEMIELRGSVEVLNKENDDLVERVMAASGEWKRVEHRGRAVEVRKKLSLLLSQWKKRVGLEKVWIGKCGRVVRVGQEIHHQCQ